MKVLRAQKGFSLIELLVALFMMSIVVAGVTQTLISTLRRTGYESRLSSAVTEAKQVLTILTTEVRMASSLSPYLLTLNQQVSRCLNAVTISSNGSSLIVRVSHDSASGTQGRESYLVGYQYVEATRELLRGEVELSTHSCGEVPGVDPLGASVAQTIARNIVRIDSDGNGQLDPVFERDGSLLLVNLGLEVVTPDSGRTNLPLPMSVSVRSL